MKIKKVGQNKWRYSGKLAIALLHHLSTVPETVDEARYSVVYHDKKIEGMCVFSCECFHDENIIMKIEGKAMVLHGRVHLVISDTIKY